MLVSLGKIRVWFGEGILSVLSLNLLYELMPYEASENRVSLELYVKGHVGSAAHRTLFLKMIHLTHALLHTQTLSLLSPLTPLGRTIFFSCADALVISSFRCPVYLWVTGITSSSCPALIFCHPALPNIWSPPLNNCSKVIDCAYASFFCGAIYVSPANVPKILSLLLKYFSMLICYCLIFTST